MSNEQTSQRVTLPQHSETFLSPRGIMDLKLEDETPPYLLGPLGTDSEDRGNAASTHVPILFLTPRHDSTNSLVQSPWNTYRYHSYGGAQQQQQQESNQLHRAQAGTPPPTNDSNFYSSNQRMILQVHAPERPNTLTLPTNF